MLGALSNQGESDLKFGVEQRHFTNLARIHSLCELDRLGLLGADFRRLDGGDQLVINERQPGVFFIFHRGGTRVAGLVLYKLAGIEETAFIDIDGDRVMSDPEHDIDRTSEDGKSSSVHFLHFPFTDDQIAKFKAPGAKVMIGFAHENYQHLAVVSDAMVARLGGDFA